MVQLEDLTASAAGGDEVAAFELAMCFAAGSGVAVDLVQAHRWFNVAAACGYAPGLRWRHEIAAEMSAREVIEAQKLARATLAGLFRKAA
jgi:hypothetical protein